MARQGYYRRRMTSIAVPGTWEESTTRASVRYWRMVGTVKREKVPLSISRPNSGFTRLTTSMLRHYWQKFCSRLGNPETGRRSILHLVKWCNIRREVPGMFECETVTRRRAAIAPDTGKWLV